VNGAGYPSRSRALGAAAIIALAVLWTSCTDDSPTAPGNGAPRTPYSPSPADGAVYGRPTLDLSWKCSDPDGDILVYAVQVREHDVYVVFSATTENTEMETGLTLLRETLYTWRVSATDGLEVTHGPWWSFTTPEWSNLPPYPPADPIPADGAEGISLTTTLFWVAGDPDQDDVLTFDVYLGTDADPPLAAAGRTQTSWAPPALEYSTGYYWRVVSKDSRGDSTSSAVWTFTTRDEPGGLLGRIGRWLGIGKNRNEQTTLRD
jgi:hypothetical protein